MIRYFLVLFLLAGSTAMAQLDDQIACFKTLQSESLKIADFYLAAEVVEGLDYATLNREMSDYYPGHSSFGIEVDQPLFDMRLYSFGRQTGYLHPPYSPFAIGEEINQWDEAAKEFILAEEYIRTPDGEREFLGCSLFRIAASDLARVTNENYLYDGDIISLTTETEGGDKLWYNYNTSFDHNDEFLAYWYRLFVYPQGTTDNTYFNRHEVLDSFPANKVPDLSVLSAAVIEERDVSGADFPELEPVEGGTPFFLKPYYQAILDQFPLFGERLALRGFFKYENLQKLLSSPQAESLNYIWETVLDPRDITRYGLKKAKGEAVEANDLYDRVLRNPDRLNRAVENLGAVPVTAVPVGEKVVNPVLSTEAKAISPWVPIGGLIGFVFLLGLVWVLVRKFNR